jgi:hypothetical protein
MIPCEHGIEVGDYCTHCEMVIPKPRRSETQDVIDEEDKAAFEARAQGIPLDFGGVKTSMVQAPSPHQLQVFSNSRVRTCGSCKNFARHHFAPHQAKFLAELKHEYGWEKKLLCEDPDKMGRCTDKGDTIVGPSSLACSNYRAKS